MSDKELLELAAKVAGYVFLTNGQVYSPEAGNFDWNPLTDDADALRLAVDIGILSSRNNDTLKNLIEDEQRRNSRGAATRRAIVRAAAEIGKAMEDQ